jgi:flagellar biosynthesis GTPase FlhF
MIRERIKAYPISLKVLFDRITKNSFSDYLALELISEVYTEIGHLAENSTKTLFFLKNAIAKRMKTFSVIDSQAPIVIMGPTGAGKTETVKKLSIMCSEKEMPVSILAFDPVKKSSYDELYAFSESTGVPFQFSATIEDLIIKIKQTTGKLFIDLTGQMDIQKKIIDKLGEFKKIIVFPAGSRDDKIEQYINMFKGCNIAGLVFSKLDEEERFGNFCHTVLTLGRPICFLTKGIRSTDILPYDKETFSRILIEGVI